MNQGFGIEKRIFSGGKARMILGLVLFLNVLVWYEWAVPGTFSKKNRSFRSDLLIRVIDVGQGTAILVETPRGRRFLIDGGPWEREKRKSTSPVHWALQRRGVSHLDGILVSHFHNDRLEGLHALLENVSVDRVWENGSNPETPAFQDFKKICARKRVPRLQLKTGDELDLGPELFAAVLHPPAEWLKAENNEQHNGMIVLLLRYGRTAILFPGDLETGAQEKLAGLREQVRSCGLVMPMSASQKACSVKFLEAVAPSFAFISVGTGNPAEYPERPVLEILKEKRVSVYRTDLQGDLEVRLGGRQKEDFEVRVDRLP